jgi:hypothetical protein
MMKKTIFLNRGNLLGIVFIISFLTSFLGCATKATGPENIETKPGVQFIDTHNHLVGKYPTQSGMQQIYFEGAAGVALTAMKRLGIRKMFIMPPPFSTDHPDRYTFDDLIGTVKKYPDRFAFLGGGGTLNVMIQEAVQKQTSIDRLKSRFEKKAMEILSKGAIGFGELTAEHLSLGINHPYESAPPDHPLFLLLSDIAARHGVPIDIHMEAVPEDMPLPKIRRLDTPHNPPTLRRNIPAFERLLAYNRNTKIIWAHAGWCNTGRRTPALCAELLEKHSNLYMSFKIGRDSMQETRPLTEDLRIKSEWLNLIRTYPDRFLIGSDHYLCAPHEQYSGRSSQN